MPDEEDQRRRRPPPVGGRREGRDTEGSERRSRGSERRSGPDLEERHEQRGRLIGDKYVRIVRPSQPELKRIGRGEFEITERALVPDTPLGRGIQRMRRLLIGRPLRTEADAEQRVSKRAGLGLFGSSNISASAYATEEIMRVLLFAGVAALNLTEPIAVAIGVLAALVIVAELRVVHAYPRGGGSYHVATENLGVVPGLVAAAALLIDYTLAIAVSVAAGVAALASAFPALHDHRVLYAVGLVGLIALANLRGVRESGLLLSGPTYLYLAACFGLIGYGLLRAATGTLPSYAPPEDWVADAGLEPLALLLILRAFASGAVGLTGTEAIANSVPAFKTPEPRNAAITLVAMGTCFAAVFLGFSFLAGALDIIPAKLEIETVTSQLARTLVGAGAYYYFIQLTTALVLLLAANTAFSGFPRLASILARDRFLPRQFAFRGERLAYSTGIGVVALVAGLILALFGGSVTRLIPLYTIAVFLAFTLSQSGLVRRWWRLREPGWQIGIAVNGLGAIVTGVVALAVATTKFEAGAWMVLVVMPVIAGTLYAIHRHYRSVEDALVLTEKDGQLPDVQRPIVVVPISRLDRAAMHAIAFARALSPNVTAVHVSDEETDEKALEETWHRWIGDDVSLQIIRSPYRVLIEPLISYLDAVDKHDPARPVTVVLAEFVPRRWWEYVLHNQTALRLKLRLFFRPNTVVVDVPYHMRKDRGGDRVS